MQMQMILNQEDLVAALAAWVASPAGGSVNSQNSPHQMDKTTAPVIAQNGTVTVGLNS